MANNRYNPEDDTFPRDISVLAESHISPPLSLFLTSSLERLRNRTNLTYKKVGAGAHPDRVLDITSFPKDTDLSASDWMTAYQRFIIFSQSVMNPEISEGFSNHYKHVSRLKNWDQWFSAIVDFDTKLCSQFWAKPFPINIYSEEYRSGFQASKDDILMAAQVAQETRKSETHQANLGPVRPFCPQARSFNPLDQSSRPFRQELPTICLRCGVPGHRYNACKTVQPPKGRTFLIHNQGGLHRLSDNKPVCLSYNLAKGCNLTGQMHPSPICTLCGDTAHGANGCPRN